VSPGYHGAYLHIDVSTGRAERRSLPAGVLRRFLGGSGLGTYLLLAHGAAQADPLSPAAPLAFVFSPLVGSPLTTSAKFAVVSRSPLTERINDSLASSQFALAGKRTGYDALLITGRAPQLSVLVIDEDRVELVAAPDLAGETTNETQRRVRERLSPDFAVAAIGPAGERLVRFATISHDGRHAGRGGHGAVLGSKNLRAVAVRGSRRCQWAWPKELVAYSKRLSSRSFGPATAKYRELGTAANLLVFNRLAALPTRNFQQGTFDAAAELSPEQLSASRDKAQKSCAACTIGCEHIYGLSETTAPGVSPPGKARGNGALGAEQPSVRLEYENLFALGPLCGIGDPAAVLRASRRCDELGIDTISTGGTIAFAMECAERDLIDAPWLRFGNGEALLRAIDEIGARRGLGDSLAEGSRRLAETIGQGTIEFAPQIKGLELPGYEPRALQTMALGFAVGTRGADHNRSGAYEVDFSTRINRRQVGPEAAAMAVETEDRAALMDSLILCKFLRGVFEDFFAEASEMLNLVTGWDTSAAELRQTAQRIVTAKKLFNIRAGWQPDEDRLPERFLTTPLADDAEARLPRERLTQLIRAYNLARGWSPEGWIGAECLRAAGLADMAAAER